MSRLFRRIFNNVRHRHFVDRLANANIVITAVSLYPQLFALMGNEHPSGFSPFSFILIVVSSCIWVAYGIHRRTPPLIISSALNAAAAMTIVVLIFLKG